MVPDVDHAVCQTSEEITGNVHFRQLKHRFRKQSLY